MPIDRETIERCLRRTPGIRDVAVYGGGLHVTVEDPEDAAPRIRRRLENQGIQIRNLEIIHPSMEDVFVALIEEEERKAS